MKRKFKFNNNIEIPISDIGKLTWVRSLESTVLFNRNNTLIAYWKTNYSWEKSKKIFERAYAFALDLKDIEIAFDDLVYLAGESYEENDFLVLNIDAELIELAKD